MGAYEIGALFRTLVGSVGVKWTLVILTIVALVMSTRKSVSWFLDEVVRLLGQWVASQTQEKVQLMRQNQEYASQIQTFLHNHMAHQKEEREEFSRVIAARDIVLGEMRDGLTKVSVVMGETLREVQEHRKEDQRRAESA